MIDQCAISWVIYALDASDFLDESRVVFVNVFHEFSLGICWPCDQHGSGAGYGLCHFVQEALIFRGMATANRIGFVVKVVGRTVRVNDESLDLIAVEVKHARFLMIDPDDRMIKI